MTQVATPLHDEIWTQSSSFLSHFHTMMGPYGLYEHGAQDGPFPEEGYCTDDNARAVQVLVRLARYMPEERKPMIEKFLAGCWQFLRDAQRESGSFYNLRTADGQWEERDVSDDMYARLVRALATVLRYDTNTDRQQQAKEMLLSLRDRAVQLTAARAWAEINIALTDLPEDVFGTSGAKDMIAMNTRKLLQTWHEKADTNWPWFEDTMVYANSLLPHGLLAARAFAPSAQLDSALEQSTQFLLTTTVQNGVFVPIGSVGWYPRGGAPSQENQQPIDAGAMFDFLVEYEHVFPGSVAPEVILAPYWWFFGANTGVVGMANQQLGASYDGLFARGPNTNYGAESMLAYLWAEIRMRALPESIQQYALQRRQELLKSTAA